MLYMLCLVKGKFQLEKDLVLTNQRTELIIITRSRIIFFALCMHEALQSTYNSAHRM